VLSQQAVQFAERLHGHTWWPQGHWGANGGVQHPASDREDDAVPDLYVDHLTRGSSLAVQAPQSLAV
jgi:hypothetical protein